MLLLTAGPRRTAAFYSPLSILSNDLADHVFDGVRLTGFKSRPNVFLFVQAARSLGFFFCFPCLFFFSMGWLLGWGPQTDKVSIALIHQLSLPTFYKLFASFTS